MRIVKEKKERCLIATLVEYVKLFCSFPNLVKDKLWKTSRLEDWFVQFRFFFFSFKRHSSLWICKEEGSLDGYGLKMEKTLYQEGEKRKGKREGKKHFQEWVCRSRQRVLFPDSWGPREHRGRGKGTLSKREENSWSWHQPSSFSLYLLRAEL